MEVFDLHIQRRHRKLFSLPSNELSFSLEKIKAETKRASTRDRCFFIFLMMDSGLRLAHYRSIMQNTDRSVQIKAADEVRREDLLTALEDFLKLVAITGKPIKFEQILKMCRRLAGLEEVDASTQAPHLPELSSDKVSLVATSKAVQVFGQGEHVDGEHPATQELAQRLTSFFNVHRFISHEGLDLIRQALPLGTVVAAADINFYQRNLETRGWDQSHKFEREGKLHDSEIIKVWEEMKQFYCFPKSGKIDVLWDNSVVMLNGKAFNFHDRLQIKSAPIDPILFDQYMHEALENGLFYSANTHFGLLECLFANGKINTIAVLSNEEMARGLTLKDKAMHPTPSDYPVLWAAILGNRPPRLIQ